MKKGRKKIDYRHCIVAVITAGMLTCWLFFPEALGRLIESFRDIVNSAAYYLNELFDLGFSVTPTVNELPQTIPEIPSILPDNFEGFQSLWNRYWQLWAMGENVTEYLLFLASALFYVSQSLLIFMPFFLLVRVLIRRNGKSKTTIMAKKARPCGYINPLQEKYLSFGHGCGRLSVS